MTEEISLDGGRCELCGRHVQEITRHHLIPQKRHTARRARRHFAREELKTRIALLCRPCHDQVHAHLDHKKLEQEYNTIEALAAHPALRKFADWVSDKPDGLRVHTRRKSS